MLRVNDKIVEEALSHFNRDDEGNLIFPKDVINYISSGEIYKITPDCFVEYCMTDDNEKYLVLFDLNGNRIYVEDSTKFFIQYVYDTNARVIYEYDSEGYWAEYRYDEDGEEIYFADGIH